MTRVLGTASAATEEDPFGPDDPLEVARLVRRALAAAGRRAVDVDGLAVVAEVTPDAAALARFTRRALGPHGAEAPAIGVAHGGGHAERVDAAAALASTHLRGGVAVAVALGPGARTTATCVGPDR